MPARLSVDFVKHPDETKLTMPAVVLLDTPELEANTIPSMLDKALGEAIARAIDEAKFKAKTGDSLIVRGAKGTVIVIGTGEDKSDKAEDAQKLTNIGGAIFKALDSTSLTSATLYAGNMSADEAANLAYGAVLASYHFPKYFTKKEDDDKAKDGDKNKPKHSLSIACGNEEVVKTATAKFAEYTHRIEGVFLARDLVSEPANVLYPAEYADRCEKILSPHGIKVDVLDEKQMASKGMRLLLSVGQGSRRESRLVVMKWDGDADKNAQPIALIGKGVCFDSGGISLKPAGGMEDMKWDMGGSAAVVGAMRAIAGLGVRRNVVGLIGLVGNMPDGQASRPGDVVESMAGQTVEIINTDAEGRLVLADVLTYARQHFTPKALVDLATLTGAIIVSLGHSHAGLFANDEKLAGKLLDAGKATGEGVWRMPLGEAYDKLLKSQIADMKNIGGRWAGAITAACFLQRFAEGEIAGDTQANAKTKTNIADKTSDKTPQKTAWAHIDIAGMAWADKASATTPRGGTGFGVRLLTRFVEEYDAD